MFKPCPKETEDYPHPMMPDNNNDIKLCVTKTWLILVADCCDNCPKCLWVCHTLSRVPSKDSHWLLSCYPALWLVPCLSWCCVDISCSDCYCWHCVACPGLNYCSPVVCCCKTPQNWSATIKLYCKWVEAVAGARQSTCSLVSGASGQAASQPPASTCSCRHEAQAQVSRRVDTDNLTLTSSPQTHSPPHSADTGNTNGGEVENIGENSGNRSMLRCIWSNTCNERSFILI